METKVKNAEKTAYTEPKKLSKAGEWARQNPNGIGYILDMRAVMR